MKKKNKIPRKQNAAYMKAYYAANPDQKRKKLNRAMARRKAAKKALKRVGSKASKSSSQTVKKAGTQCLS
jgi:hypothetical protein